MREIFLRSWYSEQYWSILRSQPTLGYSEQRARIGRPDILWSVNKLARAITKWTQACDRRLARLISYIHHTSDFRQYCHVGNTAQQCQLAFSRLRLCWRPWGLKINHGGSPTVVENQKWFRWMLDWEWMDLPALDLWDVVIEVLRSSNSIKSPKTKPAAGNCLRDPERDRTSKPKQKRNRDVDQLSHVDHVTTNALFSRWVSVVHFWKQRSCDQDDYQRAEPPRMRHVSRTHTELRLIGCSTESMWN